MPRCRPEETVCVQVGSGSFAGTREGLLVCREISRAQGSRACRCLGEQCSGQGAQPVQRLRLHLEEVGASGPRMTMNQLACLAPLPWHF